MWTNLIKCCECLFPFKKSSPVNKEYHNLVSETTIATLVNSPVLKNSESSSVKDSSSVKSVSTRASERKKSADLDTSNLEEKFDLEEAIAATPQTQSIELTTITLENPHEKFYRMGNEISELLQRKIREAGSDFEKAYEETKLPHGLKIYMKSVVIDKKTRISHLKSEWIAPCPPEKLLEIMNNVELQKQIGNSSMDQYYAFESFGPSKNYLLMYLRYKKMLTASPRDFVYFKYSYLVDQERNIWIDCSKSIEDDRFPEIKGEAVRGDINISGTYIEAFDREGIQYSKVTSYSEIDFRLNLPALLTKPATLLEFRKYVERTCQMIEKGQIS